MRQTTTLFLQLVRKIPNSMIQNAIDDFGVDRRARTLHARNHLYVLLLGHLRGVSSLRHLVSLREDLPRLRQCLGLTRVARSTLADANRSRRHEFFRALMAQVLNHCHGLTGTQARRLKRLRYSLDSSVLELTADLLSRPRIEPAPRLLDEQWRTRGPDHRSALSRAVAGRTLLQVDQAASRGQDVLGPLSQRRAHPALGRSPGVRLDPLDPSHHPHRLDSPPNPALRARSTTPARAHVVPATRSRSAKMTSTEVRLACANRTRVGFMTSFLSAED